MKCVMNLMKTSLFLVWACSAMAWAGQDNIPSLSKEYVASVKQTLPVSHEFLLHLHAKNVISLRCTKKHVDYFYFVTQSPLDVGGSPWYLKTQIVSMHDAITRITEVMSANLAKKKGESAQSSLPVSSEAERKKEVVNVQKSYWLGYFLLSAMYTSEFLDRVEVSNNRISIRRTSPDEAAYIAFLMNFSNKIDNSFINPSQIGKSMQFLNDYGLFETSDWIFEIYRIFGRNAPAQDRDRYMKRLLEDPYVVEVFSMFRQYLKNTDLVQCVIFDRHNTVTAMNRGAVLEYSRTAAQKADSQANMDAIAQLLAGEGAKRAPSAAVFNPLSVVLENEQSGSVLDAGLDSSDAAQKAVLNVDEEEKGAEPKKVSWIRKAFGGGGKNKSLEKKEKKEKKGKEEKLKSDKHVIDSILKEGQSSDALSLGDKLSSMEEIKKGLDLLDLPDTTQGQSSHGPLTVNTGMQEMGLGGSFHVPELSQELQAPHNVPKSRYGNDARHRPEGYAFDFLREERKSAQSGPAVYESAEEPLVKTNAKGLQSSVVKKAPQEFVDSAEPTLEAMEGGKIEYARSLSPIEEAIFDSLDEEDSLESNPHLADVLNANNIGWGNEGLLIRRTPCPSECTCPVSTETKKKYYEIAQTIADSEESPQIVFQQQVLGGAQAMEGIVGIHGETNEEAQIYMQNVGSAAVRNTHTFSESDSSFRSQHTTDLDYRQSQVEGYGQV
ncbi:uncharacterized protein NEMAJ01_0310 [Nematocida major]|uniref:uncharacterized protein n=1 Tax=Nematocida major TaxID=1912982 RepID=UPI00200808BC|nr:uncharacterized protein NEMAJ01_0310 [Nematocida major]KAH9385414.1 hypothetical protein NEMAJ01_0310 [Nematocida major]